MIFHLRYVYATYIKTHKTKTKIYVGRTSGLVSDLKLPTIAKVIKRRDKHHHKNKDGYDPAVLDKFSTNKEAIRGREQQLIDKFKAQLKENQEIFIMA